MTRFHTLTLDNAAPHEVAYLYVHSGADDAPFAYFPHYRNAITAYFNAEVVLEANRSLIHPKKNSQPVLIASRNYDRKMEVDLHAPFLKVGIAFEALGMNVFLGDGWMPQPPHALLPDTTWPALRTFLSDRADAFAHNPEEGLHELAVFLDAHERHLIPSELQNAVELLIEEGGEPNVQLLATRLGCTRKTLYRRFHNHLGCSVEAFRTLVRFRTALNHYLTADERLSFTALAADHAFYDQPAFIRHFKKITGFTPRSFFRNIRQHGNADTWWMSRNA
jgi:AraC-like DNA-binding protein